MQPLCGKQVCCPGADGPKTNGRLVCYPGEGVCSVSRRLLMPEHDGLDSPGSPPSIKRIIHSKKLTAGYSKEVSNVFFEKAFDEKIRTVDSFSSFRWPPAVLSTDVERCTGFP